MSVTYINSSFSSQHGVCAGVTEQSAAEAEESYTCEECQPQPDLYAGHVEGATFPAADALVCCIVVCRPNVLMLVDVLQSMKCVCMCVYGPISRRDKSRRRPQRQQCRQSRRRNLYSSLRFSRNPGLLEFGELDVSDSYSCQFSMLFH